MGKILLIVEIFIRSVLPPFYSFSMIEGVCKKKLKEKPSDKDVLWILSNLYINYKQYDKAKQPLEALYAMSIRPNAVARLLSRVYYNLNQYDKVIKVLTERAVLSPNDRENYYLGDSFVQLNEFEPATKYLTTFVKYHKDNYIPFVKLGYAHYMQGELDLAMDAYTVAEKLEPTNREIRTSIELCRDKMAENGSMSLS